MSPASQGRAVRPEDERPAPGQEGAPEHGTTLGMYQGHLGAGPLASLLQLWGKRLKRVSLDSELLMPV